MSGTDRRTVLGAAATALAWPLIASVPAIAAPASHQFVPPKSKMLYSRRLDRELPGNMLFRVERSFEVQFAPIGRGFQLTGRQVAVEVVAPAALERFAALERQREEVSLFPINLDAQGQIFGARAEQEAKLLDAAVQEARGWLQHYNFDEGEQIEIEAFVRAVHQSASGVVSELPTDLFAPVEPVRSLTRELPVPGGGEGQIQSTFNAQSDPETGLMRQALREVVSEVAGDRRRIVESWKLEALT